MRTALVKKTNVWNAIHIKDIDATSYKYQLDILKERREQKKQMKNMLLQVKHKKKNSVSSQKRYSRDFDERMVKDTTLSTSDRVNQEAYKQKAVEIIDQDFSPPFIKLDHIIEDPIFDEDKDILSGVEKIIEPIFEDNRKREIKSKMIEERNKEDFDDLLFPYSMNMQKELDKCEKKIKVPELEQLNPPSFKIDDQLLKEVEKDDDLMENMLVISEKDLDPYDDLDANIHAEGMLSHLLEDNQGLNNFDSF
mmetsp:Transcript_5847/g.5014  ORF Transcript_5847/g.5014 Transcript_5847/m.5014 type:complete len:251 (+) Transcript_5847:23-775(+)